MVQYLFHAVILIQPHDGHAVGIISIDKGKISAVPNRAGQRDGHAGKKAGRAAWAVMRAAGNMAGRGLGAGLVVRIEHLLVIARSGSHGGIISVFIPLVQRAQAGQIRFRCRFRGGRGGGRLRRRTAGRARHSAAAGKGNTNGGHKQQCSQAHSARHGLVERLFHGANLLYGVTSPR